jgi:hypothetical protein
MTRAFLAATLVALLLSLTSCGGGDESAGVWRRAGRDVDTLVIQSYRGASHCGWQDVIFLDLGWPLGSRASGGNGRMYVRDPGRVLVDEWVGEYEPKARLPEDARSTGYASDLGELWLSAGDADSVAYVVSAHGKHVEAWPRTKGLVGCD